MDIKLEEFDIPDSQTVVLKIPLSVYDLDEALDIFNMVQKALPDRTIIALPDDVGIERLGKEELQDLIDRLKECL